MRPSQNGVPPEMDGESPRPGPSTERDEEHSLAFFNEICRAFQSAAKSVGTTNCYFRVGGYVVRLCFAGEALLPLLTPALAHLATTAADPNLTVFLWDTYSTGVKMPPTPWREHYAVRGEIQGYNTERIYSVYEHESCGLSMLDNDRNLAVLWVLRPQRIPYWVRGSPLRVILHWWMGRHGRQLLHSAAVGMPNAGVLIAGKSGSGKSTSALACLDAGLLYAGDDYVIVRADPAPFAFSLYNTAKLLPDDLRAFPWLAGSIDNPDGLDAEKALFFVNGTHAPQLSSGFPLRAVLLPRVTRRRDTALKPTSAAVSLSALAPSTIFAQPRAGESEFRFIADLVKRLPAYVLECGTDLTQIPEVIGRLLWEGGP